jgi:hypothetical protein
MLERIFGPKREEEVTRSWRKFGNEEIRSKNFTVYY